MSHIAPTVLNICRSVAALGEADDALAASHRAEVPRAEVAASRDAREDARRRVASNISFVVVRNQPLGYRSKFTARDARVIMLSHGASASTAENNARAVANYVRSDFSDGRG